MKILRTIAELRSDLEKREAEGASVGFVPTMGSFHKGHTSLMAEARKRCDVVVVSLFVNPIQLTDPGAFERYPRDEERDAEMARAEGVDVLFVPSTQEMYPNGFSSSVSVGGDLVDTLITTGLARDGQLIGMCTVIVKLLNIVQPTVAYFGEKDLPHWIAVDRMARDLNLPARLEVLATVREPDGLAMSSRNVHLGENRCHACCVPRALRAALAAVDSGVFDPEAVRDIAISELLAEEGAEVDYVAILDAATMRPATDLHQPAVVAVGAHIGGVPLLDIARTEPSTELAA